MKYYDVAIINKSGWFEIVQNVLALSEVDAMHIVEIKYGVTAKDAVISEQEVLRYGIICTKYNKL